MTSATFERSSVHGVWGNRWTFVLAATGSAVGLGNIWKFPYITGEHGGGAFVLMYLVCILIAGVPIMLAEVLLGRRGRHSPITTMRTLAEESGQAKEWGSVGWLGAIAGFLILSFYSVVAGWALAYVVKLAQGIFVGQPAEFAEAQFAGLLGDPGKLLLWHTVFMLMTCVVIARGVQHGLEKAIRLLMPLLFILLFVLLGYAINSGGFEKGAAFLFDFNFAALKPESVIVALGHAFFTLSLGMGAIMVYGAYMPKKVSIGKTVLWVAVLDTAIALIAGLAIFPIVFANGMDPGAGPGLIFQTLPIAFGQMPGGVVFGALFFVLVVCAAWSSAISIAEPVIAWIVEAKGVSRVVATSCIGFAIWLLGIVAALSFNVLSDYTLWDKNVFDLLDYLTANIMLPLGGLLVALFVGYLMKKEFVLDELNGEASPLLFKIWYFALRFISPLAVLLIFFNAVAPELVQDLFGFFSESHP